MSELEILECRSQNAANRDGIAEETRGAYSRCTAPIDSSQGQGFVSEIWGELSPPSVWMGRSAGARPRSHGTETVSERRDQSCDTREFRSLARCTHRRPDQACCRLELICSYQAYKPASLSEYCLVTDNSLSKHTRLSNLHVLNPDL